MKVGEYELTFDEVNEQQQVILGERQEQMIKLQDEFDVLSPKAKKSA